MHPRLALLLAAAALGCASPGPMQPEAAASAPPLGRVVVAPLNLGQRTPPELRGRDAAVWSELLRYLRERDPALAVVDDENALALWTDAVSGLADPGAAVERLEAATRFARLLAQHAEYDVVVMPSLVVRRARVGGTHASWDGARRPLPVRTPVPIAAAVDSGIDGVTLHGYRGSIAAASLHVVIVTSDGEPLYEGLAGLDLLQELRWGAGSPSASEWTLEPRGDALADASDLRQGVERAFRRRAPRR